MTINDDTSWFANSPLPALTRRGFIGIGGASAAGLLLASCTPGDGTGSGDPTGGGNGGGTDLKEAPELTTMVEAGDLPPLEERLPTNPIVINTVERAGVYGGTWHTVSTPNDTGWMLQRTTGHVFLTRWDPDFTEVIPDVAESWEVNEDATEFVFKLREGLRWSDGEPFTSADVVFAANDAYSNPEISPGRTGTLEAEANGDYEVTIRMEPGNGLYLQQQSGPGRYLTALPKHYMEQFHKDYNDDVDDLVKEAGAQDWVELFATKGGDERGRLNNPELPVLTPWVVTKSPGASGTQVVFSRNPYYWKVDQDGRQLPYIDHVEFNIVEDPEVMVTAASNGEVDMSNRTFNIPRNKPVLAEHRESSDYHFIDMPSTFMNTTVIGINQTAADKDKREVFRNKDFRIAISHAINRQEIIDVVFQRQGEPWQAAPRAESKFYDEEFAKQYTDHNVELAKEHLAKAGVEPGSFKFSLLVSNFKPEWVDVAPLLAEQIGQIGVEVQIESVDNTLFNERMNANEHEAAIWQGDGGGNDLYQDCRWYFPFNVQNSQFATAWAQWFVSNGELGEEPSDAAKEQIDLYNQIRATGDTARQDELMTELLRISKEQFWAIGLHLPGDGYGIVKNNFHNVPKTMIDSYYWSGPGPVNPEQFFIQD